MLRNDGRSNSRVWIWLLPAALTEVGWITGVKAADSFMGWVLTAASVALSLFLALKATQYLSVTTVYILFVGLGTLGSFLISVFAFNASFSGTQLVLILVLLAGITGLKRASDQ